MRIPSESVPGDGFRRSSWTKQFWIAMAAFVVLVVAFLVVSLLTDGTAAESETNRLIALIGQPIENVGQITDTVEILNVSFDLTVTEKDGILTGFTYTGKVPTADAAKMLPSFYLSLADTCGSVRFGTGSDYLRYEDIRGFKRKEPTEQVISELLVAEEVVDLGLGWNMAYQMDVSWLAVEDPQKEQRRFDVVLWLEGDTTAEYLTLRIDYQAHVLRDISHVN